MKKLLLAGILVVGATSFAGGGWPEWPEGPKPQSPVWEDTTSSEKVKLHVKAEVVEKLVVRTEEVDFGRVAPGAELDAPKENGKITIKGEANNRVKVELESKDGKPISQGEVVYLRREGRVFGKDAVLSYTPKLNTSVGLNNYGFVSIPVGGSLKVPENAQSGVYSTDLIVKVKYAFSDK